MFYCYNIYIKANSPCLFDFPFSDSTNSIPTTEKSDRAL